jgi:hypothetical protein
MILKRREKSVFVSGNGWMSAGSKLRSAAFLVALGFASIIALVGCGGGGGSSTTVRSVNITPPTQTVQINTQADFFATVTLTDSTISTTTTVTWEVDGVAGGSATCGTIVPSTTDQLEGVYTAPTVVPNSSCGSTGQLGQAAITAVTNQSVTSSGSTTTGTITSNTAIVTVGVGTGLSVSPTAAVVPAGGSHQFSATLNSVPPTSPVTWTATSASGGSIGSIDPTGLFTAPDFPPPGATVTITAAVTDSDGTVLTTTAVATIVYSDHTLDGPYAFSYAGNDQAGFLAVAGSIVADGNGHIVSGVEDIQSFLDGISTEVAISGVNSTYSVGTDGRGVATISHGQQTETWRFVLTTNQHARMVRFDAGASGGGTIDQQSLGGLTNEKTAISGRYAFSVLGEDASFNPLGMAGEFGADGAGNVTNTNSILDVNDNGISGGTVTRGDTTLSGSYAFDSAFPGTGRGTISLTSATTGGAARVYAFYTVGTVENLANATFVSQLHLVEIDGVAFAAGDMYLATPAPPGFAAAEYVFTGGGNSAAGAYAMGGVFSSDGVSTVTGGVFDANDAGTYNNGPALSSCAFTSNPSTGRIDMSLCPTGGGALEFSAYPTSLGIAVMLELDTAAVSTGLAYQQCSPQSAGCLVAGTPSLLGASFAVGLAGQGLFRSPPALTSIFQSNFSGQLASTGTTVSGGNLDINNFSATFPMDTVTATGSSIGTPTNGRGTATLAASNPTSTYSLVYYLIDDDNALLFGSGASPVGIGAVGFQF